MTEIMTAQEATDHLSAAEGRRNDAMIAALEKLEVGGTYNIGGRALKFEEDTAQMLYFKDAEGKDVKMGYFTLLKRINGTYPWSDQVMEQTVEQVAAATAADAAKL
jgi:hypothetical protein